MINPNEEGEFEEVFGKKDSYLMTNTRASYAQNEIKLTEQDSVMLDLMQFQMEELSNEIGDRRVILEDMIVVEKDTVVFFAVVDRQRQEV